MNEFQNTLRREFQDEEYRYAYAEDFLNTSIAMQVRVLREQRNKMTQQELADRVGTKQAGISRLENVNYSAWKTQTLKKIARALGVRLKITFETFGTLLDETKEFRRESLERPDFEHDPAFAETVAVTEFIDPEAAVTTQLQTEMREDSTVRALGVPAASAYVTAEYAMSRATGASGFRYNLVPALGTEPGRQGTICLGDLSDVMKEGGCPAGIIIPPSMLRPASVGGESESAKEFLPYLKVSLLAELQTLAIHLVQSRLG
jgi:transcriptional regulator with XRE-family HTH domain